MTIEQGDLILEIPKGMQGDVSSRKRELVSRGVRLARIEDHQRGIMTSIGGTQVDIADPKTRVDRIEQRLGLTDTEH